VAVRISQVRHAGMGCVQAHRCSLQPCGAGGAVCCQVSRSVMEKGRKGCAREDCCAQQLRGQNGGLHIA
jgi:hypothetical protein